MVLKPTIAAPIRSPQDETWQILQLCDAFADVLSRRFKQTYVCHMLIEAMSLQAAWQGAWRKALHWDKKVYLKSSSGQIHQTSSKMAPLHDFIFSEWVISSCSSTRLDRRPNRLGSCQHNNFSISTYCLLIRMRTQGCSKVQWSIPRSGKAVLRSLGFSWMQCTTKKLPSTLWCCGFVQWVMLYLFSRGKQFAQAISLDKPSRQTRTLAIASASKQLWSALFLCVITPVFSAVNMWNVYWKIVMSYQLNNFSDN